MPTPVTLPKDSLVVVTGANGYIAAHVVKIFLERGYRVRGTVRDANKSAWLVKDLFAKQASVGKIELVEVPDMAADGAFDEAVRGASAFVHVATIVTFSPDPHAVVPPTIAGVVNALKACAKEPSVKRFVYTSSVIAATMLSLDTSIHFDENSWNDEAVTLAWAPPPYEPSRGMLTYAAGKVEAEKALFRFAKEEKPSFVVNSVVPYTTLGELLHEKQNASTAGLIFQLYNGELSMHESMTATRSIHVRDVALMHVAATLDPAVENARIHTWADPFNWNDVLGIFRKLYPEEKFMDDLKLTGKFIATVDDRRGLDLLKKWAGQDGWIGLEQSIKDTLNGKRPA